MNITENPNLQNIQNLPKLFLQSYATSDRTIYYRPLFPASYYLEYPLFKYRPWAYRLVNILLHILITLTIFHIALLLLPDTFTAFLSGLIFAIHPVHVESVTWVSGRVDLLCALGFFLAFYFYLKYRNHPNHPVQYFIGSLIAFFLALLSKEMAITLPLIVVFYDITFPPEKRDLYPTEKRIPVYSGYILIMILYFLLRRNAIGSTVGTDFDLSGLGERLMPVLGVMMDYIRLLIFPHFLNADYITTPIKYWYDIHVLLSLLFLTAIIYLLFHTRKKYSVLYFSGFFIFITLLPVINIFPVRDPVRIEAERFLYIPSAGYSFLLALVFYYFVQAKPLPSSYGGRIEDEGTISNSKLQTLNSKLLITILFCLLLSFYAVRTTFRNMDWYSDRVFFQKMTIDSPLSFRGFMELGNMEFYNGYPDQAIVYFEHALSLDSSRSSIYVNIANAYAAKNDFDNARYYLSIAQKLMPDDPKILSNLAFIEFKLENYDKALTLLAEAIYRDPRYFYNFYILGQIYEIKEDYPNAISAYISAVTLNPQFHDGWEKLGDLYSKLNMPDFAIEAYDKATPTL